MRKIPVYLFVGFLDGGKTTCICQMLCEGAIDAAGKPILLLQCEAGLAGYPESLQRSHSLHIYRLRTPEECTPSLFASLTGGQWGAVIVEWNGFWPCSLLERSLPPDWVLVKKYFCANAADIGTYASNLSGQTADKAAYADMVFFRGASKADAPALHRLVRQYSRRAQVMLPGAHEGWEPAGCPEKELIPPGDGIQDVPDALYGAWFFDLEQTPSRYAGRKLRLRGRIITQGGQIYFGRHVATGSRENADFWCLPLLVPVAADEGAWYLLEAKIDERGQGLQPLRLSATYPPAQEIAILR